jgi:hypothetical protein
MTWKPAEITLEGDAGRTLITARREDETQQMALTQGELLDLWTKIGQRFNLAGMGETR